MAVDQVTISTPARIHFGLFSVGEIVERKYGGIGLMIAKPRTVITASKSESLKITGLQTGACRGALSTWFNNLSIELKGELGIETFDAIPVNLEIKSCPPRHCGFGSGTQLALSSAAAVGKLLGLPTQSPEGFASTLNRGNRSAIGTHGFCRGGFLVDRGKLENEILAPLDFQSDFPEPWTIVVVQLQGPSSQGISGQQEKDAFKNLPPTSPHQREAMIQLVREQIIPGLVERDYNRFGESVYEFGRKSGMMFDSIQGGPYQSQSIADLVDECRNFGVKAVGQSSWGPCVVAIASSDEIAAQLAEHLNDRHGTGVAVEITKADNVGAKFITN